MKTSIIVATDSKNGIGKNGKMPWHISEDFKRFKKITTNHTIIMGRKTWESLPNGFLPNRYSVIITRDLEFKINNARKAKNFSIVSSLKEGIKKAREEKGNDECFIIGGGQIFEQAISIADKLYLTRIEGDFKADTFFPDYSMFKKEVYKRKSREGKYKYIFLELEK